MKILKIIALFIVVIITLALGLAYYTTGKMDAYVKTAIEKYASESLGTKASVGEVNISILQTTATISNLEIANPPGFDGPSAFKAGLIEITLNPKESGLDFIVIDRVLLKNPSVYYVRTKQTDNLAVLQDNAGRYTKDHKKTNTISAQKDGASKESKQPRVLIKKFNIDAANLSYQDQRIVSANVNLKLDDIQITDIDTGKNGAGTQEAVSKIVNAIVPVLKEAALKSVATYLNITTDTIRNVTDNAKQLGKDAVNSIQKFFQKQ